MKVEKNSPAFPCMPAQDQFGRIYAPIPGMTKYEHVLLQILCAKEGNSRTGYQDSPSMIMKESLILTEEYFKTLQKLEDAKENSPVVTI